MDEIAELQLEARRAEEARTVLKSEAFLSAFEAIRKDLTNQMSAVKPIDEKTKSKLIDMWQLTDALERWFVKTIETGDAAVMRLDEHKKLFSFFKKAG